MIKESDFSIIYVHITEDSWTASNCLLNTHFSWDTFLSLFRQEGTHVGFSICWFLVTFYFISKEHSPFLFLQSMQLKWNAVCESCHSFWEVRAGTACNRVCGAFSIRWETNGTRHKTLFWFFLCCSVRSVKLGSKHQHHFQPWGSPMLFVFRCSPIIFLRDVSLVGTDGVLAV